MNIEFNKSDYLTYDKFILLGSDNAVVNEKANIFKDILINYINVKDDKIILQKNKNGSCKLNNTNIDYILTDLIGQSYNNLSDEKQLELNNNEEIKKIWTKTKFNFSNILKIKLNI